MRQYCVYCSFMCYGDAYYCNVKEKPMTESTVKRPNNCPDFDLCPLGHVETGKQYKPRRESGQLDGQIDILKGEQA